MLWGIVQTPLTTSLFFLGIVLGTAYELSEEVLRAAKLSRDLGESEQRMALAAAATNLGVWVRDLARNEIWASDQWRALFGFEKSERLELDDVLQRLHPEDRESLSQTLADALERGGGYETEHRIVLPDGRMRWISSHGRVECNGASKPVLVRSVSLDSPRTNGRRMNCMSGAANLRTSLA